MVYGQKTHKIIKKVRKTAGCVVANCFYVSVGCWLLAIGCWLLAIGCWLLAIGCWLFVNA